MAPEIRKADFTELRKELVAQFPGAQFGEPSNVSRAMLASIEAALLDGGEEAIQKSLTSNPYLLQYVIPNSGHHGTWVFPKAMIKLTGMDGSAGMIPDYLVATKSSLGYFWHVVEIKRSDVQFANTDGSGYSPHGHKGIAQCTAYLNHFQNYVDAVRSSVRVNELIQPTGAVLLIGDSNRETSTQKKCREDFVRTTSKIDVVSYRRIVQALKSDLDSRGR